MGRHGDRSQPPPRAEGRKEKDRGQDLILTLSEKKRFYLGLSPPKAYLTVWVSKK